MMRNALAFIDANARFAAAKHNRTTTSSHVDVASVRRRPRAPLPLRRVGFVVLRTHVPSDVERARLALPTICHLPSRVLSCDVVVFRSIVALRHCA